MPDWDLPPSASITTPPWSRRIWSWSVATASTLATFPSRWRAKIRLFDYALDERLWETTPAAPRLHNQFVYVATHCGLRKGFLDG